MFAPLTSKRKHVPKLEDPSSSSSSEDDDPIQSKEASDDEDEEEVDEDDDDDDDSDEEDEEEEVEEEDSEEEEDDDDNEEEEEEEEDEGSKRDTVRKLLEPFGKDQLLEMLKEAALKDPSIVDRISKAAEVDPIHRKIFVHGLGWDATSETVLTFFKQYGQIEDCKVVADKVTGKSKGYGFVLFKNRDGARKALRQPQKKIGNRMTSCQLAAYGPIPMTPPAEATERKIFVANVGQHVNPEKLKEFFGKYGEIEEGPMGCDRVTGKFRGFALFVYKTAEGCKKALEEPIKMFEGCRFQCHKAIEGLKSKNQTSEPPSVASAGSGVVQPSDHGHAYSNYAMGGQNLNPGMGNQTLNAGMGSQPLNPGMGSQPLNPALLMGQSQGYGVFNPAAFGTSLNHTGLSPSVARGLSPSVSRSGTAPSLGIGAGHVGQPGINSISPSVIGSYDSQAALRGLGAYQNAQLGQSAPPTAATRPHPGFGSMGTLPPYYGR